jgi:hypothetical protein
MVATEDPGLFYLLMAGLLLCQYELVGHGIDSYADAFTWPLYDPSSERTSC